MLLKLLPIWKANPARTVRECQDHNRFNHSRLVASLPDFSRYMCRYVLNYTLDIDGDGFAKPAEWAGVAENCFYSAEGFGDAFADPSYAHLREDEVRFADFSDLILVSAVPTPIFGAGRNAPFKLFRTNWLRNGVDPLQARKLWEIEYARAIAHDPRLRTVVTSYVQNRPMPLAHSFPPSVRRADALDEFWIDDLDVLPEFLEREAEARAAVGYDDVFDPARSVQLMTESKLVWDLGEDPTVAVARTRRA